MEYMDAGHLGECAGEMDLPQKLWTAVAVTRGVRHAHTRGIAQHLQEVAAIAGPVARAVGLEHQPGQRRSHEVLDDPADSPILRAALDAGVDFLVTNDEHLRALDPYESLRIISMTEYFEILENEGYVS